ncbi:MAG: acyl-CoA dehydrogenase family protein [Labedaea sp.]
MSPEPTDLTDERLALRDSVRALLARESDSARVRAAAASPAGFDRALWTRLCTGIGVAGLGIPEEYGGLGAGLSEVAVVQAELGRTLTPGPMLGSAVLAARAVLAAGDEPARRRLLPGIAAGRTVAALAWVGPDGRWSPDEAACAAGPTSTVDWTVTGTAHYVLDGAAADLLVVVAQTGDGPALFEVDPGQPGVHRERTPALDPTRHLATVRFSGAAGRRLGGAEHLDRVRDVACAALAAEQAGTARRCLELTVAYTKERVQFGRPLASFQALKHRMADLHVLVETAESAALAAATAADLPRAAAVAKIYCADALSTVAGEMIQLHGGIAITWEHDAHLYFKRAHGGAQLFGHPREHLARLSP